jgi:hypothetical protein
METNTITITKSDFRSYLEAPRHLWAKKNDRLDSVSTDQLASIQGEQIEQLAKEYIEKLILPAMPGQTLSWQETRSDGSYLARTDALGAGELITSRRGIAFPGNLAGLWVGSHSNAGYP